MNQQLRHFSNSSNIQPARNPFPADARPEIYRSNVLASDDKLWVPQGEGISFLPLCLGVTQGHYVNLLRVRKSGVLSCHLHSGTVHAQVLKGRWFYMEHDWVASQGDYVMEAPGETHTLIVPDDVKEMITWFHVTGGYLYLNSQGALIGHEDVFTKIEKARQHYEQVGIPETYLQSLIR